MIEQEQLDRVLHSAKNLRIGLVGDLFLDRYLELAPTLHETSIETGLEAYQVQTVRNVAGALGTVINNLVALGAGTILPLSVIGDDGHGYDLMRVLSQLPRVRTEFILKASDRLTPTYTKPVQPMPDGSWSELNRLDVRSRNPLSEQATRKTCDALQHLFPQVDGLIVLDQVPETNFGVVNDAVRHQIEQLATSYADKIVLIDSRNHIGDFSKGILKGNRHELTVAAGLPDQSRQDAEQAATQLANRTGSPVFCTRGEQGILVAIPNRPVLAVDGCPVSGPIDIVGAGDSATSALVVALLAGADAAEAASLANLVASITVQQIGTTGTASPDQIRERWKQLH